MALAQSLMVIEKGWDRDFLTSVNLEAEKYGISPVKVKVPKKKEEEKGEVLAPVEKKQGESIPEAHDVTQINEEGKSPKE
jgi:hypothetical protein